MKKILIVIVLGITVASCKKDNVVYIPYTSDTITALVDNVPAHFNVEAQADTAYHSYSGHILVINGWDGEVANSNFISFSIVCPHQIGPGVYNPSSFFYWQQSDSTAYNFSDVSDVNVAITSVTDSTVGGLFSGTVNENYHDGSSRTHTITNGKFDVSIAPLH